MSARQAAQHQYTIGIDGRMYGPEQTGIGTYIQELTRNIFAIDKKNRYVLFLLDPAYTHYIAPPNVKKVRVVSPWYSWREQYRLPLEFLRERVDLMHFPHFNAPLLWPGKMVVTIHDLTPRFFPGHKMDSSLRKFGFRTVFSGVLRKASRVIAVSHATKDDILRYHAVREAKIEVIHEGVKPLMMQENQNDIRTKYGITKPFLFYVGVWRGHKNLVGLVRAFHILRTRYGLDISLVLGGAEDPHFSEVRATWESLNLEKEIIRPGFIPEGELTRFYQAASLLVIPSFREGFGFIGLEAASLGTPVAASYIPALREVLGRAAVYFDPQDPDDMARKMWCVLRHVPLREECIASGFERVKRYSWESCARETLRVYEEVLHRMV